MSSRGYSRLPVASRDVDVGPAESVVIELGPDQAIQVCDSLRVALLKMADDESIQVRCLAKIDISREQAAALLAKLEAMGLGGDA